MGMKFLENVFRVLKDWGIMIACKKNLKEA